jgi:cytochrome c553
MLQQVEQRSGHTLVYLKGQWERQRQQQLQAMDNGTETEMMKQVEDLVVLEDKLFEAQ